MYYSIVEISMFVEHGKLYYFVMANYTILSWQFSTRILPWLFSACRPKEHGNFPFCSMVNLFFITMAKLFTHFLQNVLTDMYVVCHVLENTKIHANCHVIMSNHFCNKLPHFIDQDSWNCHGKRRSKLPCPRENKNLYKLPCD